MLIARAGSAVGDLELLTASVANMRKQASIFAYDGVYSAADSKHPNVGYHVDFAFAKRLEASGLRTSNPSDAHLYFVPFSAATCRFTKLDPRKGGHRGNLRSVASCAAEMRRGTARIASRWPWLARRNGSDHFWVSSHDAGHDFAVLTDARFRANAIAIANSADTDPSIPSGVVSYPQPPPLAASAVETAADRNRTRHAGRASRASRIPPFSPSRDVSCVPYVGGLPGAVSLPPPARRKVLAFFAGTVRQSADPTAAHYDNSGTGHARELMADGGRRFNAQPPSSAGRRRVRLVSGSLRRTDYIDALLDSVFCLAPRGHAVWSPRLVEAILHGCIPVLIADTYWPPLRCFVDWRRFSVRVAEAEAANVAHMLAEVPAARVQAMHAELLRVRHLFAFQLHAEQRTSDAFDVLLLEAWLRGTQCGRAESFARLS